MPDQADSDPALVFQSTIKRLAKAHAWPIEEITGKKVSLKMHAESGNAYELDVFRFEKNMLLEFSVSTELTFPSGEEVPHWLSTFMLERNAKMTVGFWCLQKVDEKLTYAVIHNEEIGLLNSDYFGRIGRKLVWECDDMLDTLKQMES